MRKSTGTSGRKRVVFEVRAEPESSVYIAGSFNDWDPEKKALVDKGGEGVYSAIMLLPKGRHEYKFVVNGSWCIDPDCEEWTANDQGSLNSVIHVG